MREENEKGFNPLGKKEKDSGQPIAPVE